MPFGPFLSQEEKDKINAAHRANYGGNSNAASKGKDPTYGQSPVLRNLYEPGVMVGEDVTSTKRGKDIDTEAPTGVTVRRRPTTFELSQRIRDGNPDSYETVKLPAAAKPPVVADPPNPVTPAPTEPPGGGGGGGTGRNTPDPAGTGAKGTNTGYKIDLGIANALLDRTGKEYSTGIADINNFVSNSLPTVDISGPEFDAKPNKDGTFQAPEMVVVGGKAVKYSKLDSALNDQVAEGISTPGKSGSSPADTADNNRSVSIPGEGSRNWMEPREKSRSELRKEAFLNPHLGSMAALRSADESVGLFQQGGKHFVNDGGTLREIDKESYKHFRHNDPTAESLKDAYVDKIKEDLVPVAESGVFEKSGSDYPTELSTPSANPIAMSDAQAVEFTMNNDAPGYGSDRARMKLDYFNAGNDDDED